MPRDYVERILRARVYEVAKETPLDPMPILSERLGNTVLLKREDLQPVFSFKLRGAHNKIANLSPKAQARGVICASAGNHAQGVALSAKQLGLRAVIVMPETTPMIKIDAVRRLGAEIILHGTSVDEARAHAEAKAKAEKMTFVHPYDDRDVIAGQGTVAMEILRQHPEAIDAIFVAIGGGGLIAGIAAYVKALWPHIKIIGVEPVEAACMHEALRAGRRIKLKQVGLFADGVAVAQVGAEPFRIARQCVDEVILVTTDEICAAIKDIYDDTRSIAEPAGALGVAGLKEYATRRKVQGKTLVAVDCGANVNFDRLRHISERAEIGEHREGLLAVTIPEKAGSFKKFCKVIGARSVTEFNYRYSERDDAYIFVGIELRNGEQDKLDLIKELRAKGYPVVDITDNELAKLHIRYMVGGRAQGLEDERIYRFEFPERPGALLNFLNRMGEGWNISLFHYRNHGNAFGRVLVGIQVPAKDNAKFRGFLRTLGYASVEETLNPAYDLFLK
ncbi:MAG: threonine ammonia-lyase, biosynthetic [Alphaproteobacteria bacterium]|nr:threonine ammonia-lyase, biosynthetic [Alphaproteobacteria bacterium]